MSQEIKGISVDRRFNYDVPFINRPNPPLSRIDEKIQSIAQRRFQQRLEKLEIKRHIYTVVLSIAACFSFIVIGIPFVVIYGILLCKNSIALNKHKERSIAAEERVAQTQAALDDAKRSNPREARAPLVPVIYQATKAFSRIGKKKSGKRVYSDYLAMAHAPVFSSEKTKAPLFAPEVPTLVGPAGSWVPQRVFLNQWGVLESKENAVTSTSERELGSLDLPTIYVKTPDPMYDKRPAVITTGFVDTPEKRNQFEFVLKKCLKQQVPVRISMHQLNSTIVKNSSFGEGKNIIHEHEQSLEIGKTFQNLQNPSLCVAHTNNAMLFRLEVAADGYNRQAYQTYMQWALEDNKELLKGLVKNPADKSFFEQPRVKNIRSFVILKYLMQPEIKASARLLLELACDREVGAISQINCKSGLDRTGHIRALEDALSALIQENSLNPEERSEEYLGFLLNIDAHMKHWNRKTQSAKSIEIVEQCSKESVYDSLCYRFQTCYFDSLQRVGIPITASSTGVPGFKWSHKAEGSSGIYNPHPLPFFPKFAYSEISAKAIQLISEKRNQRFFTKKGIRLLQGSSAMERDVLPFLIHA